ncbi:MAG: redoxin domain-containing protein [Candidatus Eisenbacteria bacterium]
MTESRRSWPRTLALAILVIAMGAAGVYVGMVAGRKAAPDRLAPRAPTHGLPIGERFPTVALLDEQGSPLVTDDLWREHGAVVLLLDLECAPCASMVDQWQAYARSDSLAGLPVVGVTWATPQKARDYRAANAVAFPIYADTAGAFLRDHGVTDFPLSATVSRSGVLQHATFDPYEPVRAGELRASLER